MFFNDTLDTVKSNARSTHLELSKSVDGLNSAIDNKYKIYKKCKGMLFPKVALLEKALEVILKAYFKINHDEELNVLIKINQSEELKNLTEKFKSVKYELNESLKKYERRINYQQEGSLDLVTDNLGIIATTALTTYGVSLGTALFTTTTSASVLSGVVAGTAMSATPIGWGIAIGSAVLGILKSSKNLDEIDRISNIITDMKGDIAKNVSTILRLDTNSKNMLNVLVDALYDCDLLSQQIVKPNDVLNDCDSIAKAFDSLNGGIDEPDSDQEWYFEIIASYTNKLINTIELLTKYINEEIYVKC